MPSKIKRRSGTAFTSYMKLIDFTPNFVIMAGVGVNCEEIDVMREEWGDRFELYGFEPSKSSFDTLKKNFPGLLHNDAVWNENCVKRLHVKPGWKDGSSLFESKDEEDQRKRQQQVVQCIKLDTLFEKHMEDGDFESGALWLDCEGSELQALQGAEKLIECVDAINVEMTCLGRGVGWSKTNAVNDWLEEHGFIQMFIHTIRPPIGQFDAIYVRDRIYNPDLTHCFH